MKRTLLVFFLYALITVLLTAPVSLAPHRLAANEGDPLHISWILAWDAHQLIRDPLHLFDSNTFYPYPRSLSFSEHMSVLAILAAPVYLLTGNALLAQNLTVLLMYALSALALFLFAREILGRDDAAFIAGLLFAFNSNALSHLPRLQLLSFAWWPLAALYLHRFLKRGDWTNACLFGLFILLQNLSCTYYLIYFSLALLWWIPGSFIVLKRRPDRDTLFRLAVPLLVAAALTTLFALPYLGRFGSYGYERRLGLGLDLIEYLAPERTHLLWGWLPFAGRDAVSHFLGFVSLALILTGLAYGLLAKEDRVRRGMVLLSAATAFIGMVLSLGPIVVVAGNALGEGPYWFLYDHVPLFRGLRSPERIAVLVSFGTAVLGGYGAKRLLDRLDRLGKTTSRATVALLVLLPLEHYRSLPAPVSIPTGNEIPPVYTYLATLEGDGPVVELPLYPRVRLRYYALYMFYSTFHWKPILFGRTSFYPPVSEYLAWQLRRFFPDADSIALLQSLGVKTLVVHPRLWPPEERATKLAQLRALPRRLRLLRRFPTEDREDYERLGFGGEVVFRLEAGEERGFDPACTPRDEIERQGWSIEGSGDNDPAKAIDGDPRTKWRKRAPAREDYLRVDLGREEIVSAIRLPFSYPYDEFPRYLVLRGRDETGPGRRIRFRQDLSTKLELINELINDPSRAALTLRFPPTRVRWLRLLLRNPVKDLTLPDWSVSEIHVYRSCEP